MVEFHDIQGPRRIRPDSMGTVFRASPGKAESSDTNLPTTRKKQPSKYWVTYPLEKSGSRRKEKKMTPKGAKIFAYAGPGAK